MSTKAKSKRMTAREKAERAQIRKELRADGILPPPRKPLNRKKFCEEARAILDEESIYDMLLHICWAMAEMLGHTDHHTMTLTRDAVGAAKVLKLAKARKDFEESRREHGKPAQYKLQELYDAVKDIYNA